MNKWIIFILLFLVFYGCASNNKTINVIDSKTDHEEFDSNVKIMNPYQYFGLEKTIEIEIQMTECIEVEPTGSSDVPMEKVLLSSSVQKSILKEFNRDIEYVNDFCLCGGDGDLIFTLADGSKVVIRLKHGGDTLEYNPDAINDLRHFSISDTFAQMIKEYYPETLKDSYRIDERLKDGKITENQWEKEHNEHMRRYYPEDWVVMMDDPAIKDEFYKKTIVGSWFRQLDEKSEKVYSLFSFLPDGEAWHSGIINTPKGFIDDEIKCEWEVKDCLLIMTLKSYKYADILSIGEIIKNDIFYMSDRFMILKDKDGNKHTYRKIK